MQESVSGEGEFPTTDDQRQHTLDTWSLDKLIAKFEKWFESFKSQMAHWSDRGPDPDYDERERDLTQRYLDAVKEGARLGTAHVHNTNHGNGHGHVKKDRLWAIVQALLVLGIPAVIYQLSDLKADMRAYMKTQEMQQKDIDRLKNRVFGEAP